MIGCDVLEWRCLVWLMVGAGRDLVYVFVLVSAEMRMTDNSVWCR